ncbi:MAG: plasmid stabilization protein, partial [Clostridia bacterium]
MDKEILEILKRLESKVDGLEQGQNEINKKLDGVVEQTADLLEFRSEATKDIKKIKVDVEEIKKNMYRVEEATANNWADIAK